MWYRTGPRHDAALKAFLEHREESHLGLLVRILKDGKIRRPSRISGGLFARNDANGTIADALLLTSSGYIQPVLRSDIANGGFPEGESLLPLVASRCSRPSSVVGPERDVRALLSVLKVAPHVTNTYYTMVRGNALKPDIRRNMPGEVTVRKAETKDLEDLYPLQEAYEREEVITSIHRFEEQSCRRNLERSLMTETVYLAESGGIPVAKAQTNARGFRFRQLGGIYVVPGVRGLGIGTNLVESLCHDIESEGISVCLFVKRENRAAIRAYGHCGFAVTEDFMIGYFS